MSENGTEECVLPPSDTMGWRVPVNGHWIHEEDTAVANNVGSIGGLRESCLAKEEGGGSVLFDLWDDFNIGERAGSPYYRALVLLLPTA